MASSSSPAAAAASSASLPPAAAAAAPLPTSDHVDQLLSARRYSDLLAVAQRRELEEGGVLASDSSSSSERELWAGVQILAAALSQQHLSARFAWQRIPAEAKKKSPELQALWKLVSLLLQRDYVGFFSGFPAAAPLLASRPLLARMLTLLRAEVQSHNERDMRRAYAVVGAEVAGTLLGVAQGEVGALLTAQGWTADAEGRFFTPPDRPEEKARDMSQQQIEQLTGYIAHLEE